MNSNAHKTAIARRQPSAPMRYLDSIGAINGWGDELDYGCGRGLDADTYNMDRYDPHYAPDRDALRKGYDVITCNYVLNVIPDAEERQAVLDDILSLLNDNGVAYVTVRNDKRSLNGTTKTGTWQGYIELDYPVEKRTPGYVMYRIYKNNEVK